MTVQSVPTSTAGNPVYRFLFGHQVDEYPSTGRRTGYLAIAVLATIVLYYTYYTQTGVTPNILRSYHMSFSFYVWVVIVSNLLGAFASLPASKTDKLGRANVIIYGLLIIGLLVTFGVPNAGSEWSFAIVISAIGLVEGAILVATPAMVRDFSPQLGRASAMGFWTVGPVAGSLITSIVANRTLSHFVDWQSQFIISGITALAAFLVALFFMKDLSSKLRDQIMLTTRDRTLVEARARGLSETDVEEATRHPWRQIAKWDLAVSSFGIAVFLLIYYCAASFFTIYYAVTFQNANHTNFSVTQVNGLNTWFWGADIVALIVVGALSDRLRVRKPFMLLGTVGSIVTLIVFLGYASNPHTSFSTLALTSSILAVCLSLVFAPWMAGYTETVEAKNPALVGTGLALWGWILRMVVGISFIFLPLVITTVNPVVDNLPVASAVCYPQPVSKQCVSTVVAAKTHISGQTIATFAAEHPKNVAFAQAHAAFLTKLQTPAVAPVVAALSANTKTAAALGKITKLLSAPQLNELIKLKTTLKTMVVPYVAQLNYMAAHQSPLETLQKGVKTSPKQWQHWFWVDIIGMVVFAPTIFLTKGRWSPRKAKQDEEDHDRAVAEELARLLKAEEAVTLA
jgi:MFS family permease